MVSFASELHSHRGFPPWRLSQVFLKVLANERSSLSHSSCGRWLAEGSASVSHECTCTSRPKPKTMPLKYQDSTLKSILWNGLRQCGGFIVHAPPSYYRMLEFIAANPRRLSQNESTAILILFQQLCNNDSPNSFPNMFDEWSSFSIWQSWLSLYTLKLGQGWALTNPYDPNFKIQDNRFNIIWILHMTCNAKEHEYIIYDVYLYITNSRYIVHIYDTIKIYTHTHTVERWDDICDYEKVSAIPPNKWHMAGI